jgi:beta-glucosidase
MLDVTRALKDSRAGEWRHLSVPLSCFTAAGADLSAVVAPLAVESSGRLELTITEVGLAQDNQARRRPCP